ncbi:unnamed protein product [Mytilus edulis]|uniref:Mutator-like transposase domain-containing protein n=1 Tax=Mytilus edulis TaxID=6550 RepID=A0A8S3TCK0_MYTED|nr:unnamed protein product [Mytilus edulis]
MSVKVSLKSSDKGSYYNQEEYASEFDTTNSDSSLYSRENNLNSSVSFLKLTSPFEQSFEVEDIAAASSVAAADTCDNDDDNNDDESDKEMNITWEVNSNNENISDSDMSSDDQEDVSVTGRALIQLEILQKKINQAAICSTCKTGELNVIDASEINKSGLCLKLAFRCNECHSNTVFDTDEKGNFEFSKIHNVNRLSVLAMRMMGKSRNALLKFCSILDLPSPVNYGPYKKHTETWKEIATEIIEENLSEAAEEIQQLKRNSGWDGEGACKCSVSVDGSWAHVGYSSRFGFVSVISVDTGKVLDYVTLSNECKACKKWEREGKAHTRDFLQWFVEHEKDCTLNHDGSAKTMEAQGAVILFRRSEEKHSLQYTTYVGDGDSSAYGNVVDSRPYGPNIIIAKEDCVGHIQGRMGKHLRRLDDQYKGRKLEDGKQLTGKGRLTNKLMNSFQTFYGMAIRNNKGNVNAMRQNVMAILFHYASTAENPMHHFCPEGNTSWCKWQVDKDCGSSTYRPLKNPLSEVVVQILKPVFEKLSDEKLLTGAEKCLTQNQNESLYHVIWSYLPKGEYHSAGEIQLGTALAVGHFNSGMANFNTKLFEKTNISVGDNNKRLWTNIDSTRIRHSLNKTSEKGKKRRKQLKAMET